MFRICIFVCFLLQMNLVQASCNLPKNLPDSPEDWERLELQLSLNESSCINNSAYYALLGQSKLRLGDAVSALINLERALMLNPNNMEAKVDFADALILAGDVFAGIEVFDLVLSHPELPSLLESALKERKSQINALLQTDSLVLKTQLAFNSNLNNGVADASLDEISSIFNGLELSSDYLERAGMSFLNSLSYNHARQVRAGLLTTQVMIDGRLSEIDSTNYTSLLLGVMFDLPERDSVTSFRSWVASTRYGAEPLVERAGFAVQKSFNNFMTFRPWVSIEKQNFQLNPALTGTELKVGLTANVDEKDTWVYSTSVMKNWAESQDRPGGGRTGVSLGLDKQWRIGSGDVFLSIESSFTRDDKKYTDWKGLDKIKINKNIGLDISYEQDLANQWRWFVSSEVGKQWSNIPLFQNQAVKISAGLIFALN